VIYVPLHPKEMALKSVQPDNHWKLESHAGCFSQKVLSIPLEKLFPLENSTPTPRIAPPSLVIGKKCGYYLLGRLGARG
jgi:hypothetical protein